MTGKGHGTERCGSLPRVLEVLEALEAVSEKLHRERAEQDV